MKKYVFFIVMSLFLIIFGFVLTLTEIIDFKIADSFNDKTVSKKEMHYQLEITSPSVVIDSTGLNKVDIIYDDDVKAGTIEIGVTYYNDLVKIEKYNLTDNNSDVISIVTEGIFNKKSAKEFFEVTIEGLKDKEVYDYYSALKPNLKILVNSADEDIVKIRR